MAVAALLTLVSSAGVAELVDARDSKSRSLGSAGSIPAAGISNSFRNVAAVEYRSNPS